MTTIQKTRTKKRPIANLSPLDQEVKKVRKKRQKAEAISDLGRLIRVRDGMRKRAKKKGKT